jgi:hypothetical protein
MLLLTHQENSMPRSEECWLEMLACSESILGSRMVILLIMSHLLSSLVGRVQYGTVLELEMMEEDGEVPIHRKSFSLVFGQGCRLQLLSLLLGLLATMRMVTKEEC